MKFLASVLLICVAVAHAATATTSVSSCTNGGNVFKTVPISTQTTVEVTQNPGVSPIVCQLVTGTPSTWFVRTSTNGGTSWTWTLISSLGAGTSTTTPVSITVSWTAPTTYTTGAPIGTTPITYNLYKGTSATTLTKVGSVAATSYVDSQVTTGTQYFYAVTATCAGCAESAKTPAVAGYPAPAAAAILTPMAPTGVSLD